MDRSFVERNAAARERVHAALVRLGTDGLQRPLGDGWTVGAALAHLAFYDRCYLHRLERWERDGTPPPPLADVEAINEASLPLWAAIPAQAVMEQLTRAMERVDTRLTTISPALAEAIIAAGHTYMLERSHHRNAHLDEIEAALGLART